jgi:hypothetical protein
MGGARRVQPRRGPSPLFTPRDRQDPLGRRLNTTLEAQCGGLGSPPLRATSERHAGHSCPQQPAAGGRRRDTHQQGAKLKWAGSRRAARLCAASAARPSKRWRLLSRPCPGCARTRAPLAKRAGAPLPGAAPPRRRTHSFQANPSGRKRERAATMSRARGGVLTAHRVAAWGGGRAGGRTFHSSPRAARTGAAAAAVTWPALA